MKDLILVRHAKSSWDLPVDDIDRPLTDKGIETAYKVAEFLKSQELTLDGQWLSSPANRALHTARIFAESFEKTDELKIVKGLYTFSPSQLKAALVENLDAQEDSAIVFCHNEAVTYLANEVGNEFIERIYTSGFAWIRFTASSWKEAFEQRGNTQLVIRPKNL